MKTNHLKAVAGTTPEDNDLWQLYHYNIAKNHNQRYMIVDFISWFLLRFYYVFRLVFTVKYALKGLQYGQSLCMHS